MIVGKWDPKEVDFVTEKNGVKAYWQVCPGYHDDRAEERELAPLRLIDDNFSKIVILLDGHGRTVTRDGIIEMDMMNFLLDQDPI